MPPRELKGAALVQALQKGGYNLYMRHALQFPPVENEDCNKPALKPQGIEEVEQVAASLSHNENSGWPCVEFRTLPQPRNRTPPGFWRR